MAINDLFPDFNPKYPDFMEDKRVLNSDETEFAMENYARLPQSVKSQLIQSGQAPQQYMTKERIDSYLTTYNSPNSKYGTPSDRNLMNQTYGTATSGIGASQTTSQDLARSGVGSLPIASYMPQAQALLGQLSAKTPEEKEREDRINTGMMFLNFFTKMGAEASKPGATALGAANIAGADTAKMYIDRINAERKRKSDERKSALNIALQLQDQATKRDIALGKAKRGAPKVVEMGPTGTKDDKGNDLFKFNVYDPLGNITSTYEAPRKGGINIDLGKKTSQKFGEVFSTNQAKAFGTQLDASSAAVEGMQTVDTLLNILAQPDFDTGPWEEFKLPLKTLGLSFGLFDNDDTTIDNIASAEAFRAKAYEIVLNSVSKMKGALSDKELGFLSAQGPTLSKTTEGNKLLLYLNKHQLNKASQFRSFVIEWSDKNNEGQFPQDGASYNRMLDDWKQSDVMKQNPYQYIKSEAEKYENQLITEMGGAVDENGDLIPGSLSGDTFQEQQKIEEIVNKVKNKFSLNMLKKVFKNSGFMK